MGAYKDKNGTWYAQFRFTNWKGEADRKTKRGFATKKEALEWEREFLTQSAGNLEMTFEAFYELYKKNLQDRLKKNTWKMKTSVIESKILPYFKKKRMCDIKPRDIVAWQNIMLQTCDDNGEPYSPVYLKTIHNQISAIFNHAVKFYELESKANLKALNKQAQRNNPQFSSNPYSRWQQKRAIKKEYMAAKAGKTGKNTAKATQKTAKTAKKAAENTKKSAEFLAKHWKGALIALATLLIVAFLLSVVSSCSVMVQSGVSAFGGSSYSVEDDHMKDAEAQYCAMEAELQEYLDTYESTHYYDEYHYDLDEIEHDPYVLLSAISALHGGEWTIDEIGGTLQMLFDKQYILTETVTTETRYRTETRTGERQVTDPETGAYLYDEYGEPIMEEYEYEVQVPYTYYTRTV